MRKEIKGEYNMMALKNAMKVFVRAFTMATALASVAVITTGCPGKDKKKNSRRLDDRDYLRDRRYRDDLGCRNCSFSGDRVASVLGRSSTPQNGFQLALEVFGDYSGAYDGFTSGYNGGVDLEGYMMVDQDNTVGCFIPHGDYEIYSETDGQYNSGMISTIKLIGYGINGDARGSEIEMTLYQAGTIPGVVYDYEGYDYNYTLYGNLNIDYIDGCRGQQNLDTYFLY